MEEGDVNVYRLVCLQANEIRKKRKIMAPGRWASETTIKFIQEFKFHECLWNPKSIRYKNKSARYAAYQKLVEEMDIPGFGVPEAIKKMRVLRSTYYQEKKKMQNSIHSGCGTHDVYVTNIPWYTEMDQLLKDVDDRRTGIENPNNSTIKQEDYIVPSNTLETENEDLNQTHEDVNTYSVRKQIHDESPQPAVKNISKRKGIFQAIGESKKLQEAINSEVPVTTDYVDRFDVFGKSVAIQLRSISFEKSMIAQSQIQNILTEFSIEDYRNMSTKNNNDV